MRESRGRGAIEGLGEPSYHVGHPFSNSTSAAASLLRSAGIAKNGMMTSITTRNIHRNNYIGIRVL